MAKHTQTICRQIADELLSVFDHFVELTLKGLRLVSLSRRNQSIDMLSICCVTGIKNFLLENRQKMNLSLMYNQLINLLCKSVNLFLCVIEVLSVK